MLRKALFRPLLRRLTFFGMGVENLIHLKSFYDSQADFFVLSFMV